MIRLSALAAIALPMLVGCTQTAGTAAPQLPATQRSAALLIAEALAQADQAASQGRKDELVRPLTLIASLNARPLDAEGEAALTQWQSRSPDPLPPMRGRTLGPGYRHGTLDAGGDMRIEQTFLSGQKASIALSSPNGAKLRLQVIDGASQPVCQHVAERPSCEWVPMYTQRHVIHLANPGRQTARFYLVIE